MKKIFLLLAFWLVPSLAEAVTYYVAQTGGSNLNNCNQAQNVNTPKQTINNFLSNCKLGPGDTLNIKAGTYAESIDSVNGNVPPGGTDWGSGAVTIQAFGSDTVIITGSSDVGIRLSTPTKGNEYKYFIFKNLDLNGVKFVVGGGNNGGLVNHIKLDHMIVRNVTNSTCVDLGDNTGQGDSNWVMGGTIVHDCGNGVAATNQLHGFYMSSSNNIVEDTEVYNVNNGYGIHNYDPTALPSNNIYRRVTIHEAGIGNATYGNGCAVLLSGNNNLFYNNICYHSANGVGVTGNGNKVYSNTFYNIGFSGCNCDGVINLFGSSSAAVVNNIIYNITGTTAINTTGGSGFTSSNNFTTDPLFVNAAGGDFHLQPTSTAINAGTANIAPGVTIPACSASITVGCYNGSAPDIGALETGVAPAGGPPTLTPNPSIVVAGAPISVTVDDDDVNERVENIGDWVGLFAPGTAVPPGGVIDGVALFDWYWMSGDKVGPPAPVSDAVINFTAPKTPGTYEFRFYRNGTNDEADRLATAPFTVIAPGIVMKLNISSLKIGPSVTWKIGTP